MIIILFFDIIFQQQKRNDKNFLINVKRDQCLFIIYLKRILHHFKNTLTNNSYHVIIHDMELLSRTCRVLNNNNNIIAAAAG